MRFPTHIRRTLDHGLLSSRVGTAELEQFRVLVGRLKRGDTEQSMIVRGLRGVGKTVLLNAFEDHAESEGFLTYYHELTPDTAWSRRSRGMLSALRRAEVERSRDGAVGRPLSISRLSRSQDPKGVELDRRYSEG